jgi:GntR family transcriptional regulator
MDPSLIGVLRQHDSARARRLTRLPQASRHIAAAILRGEYRAGDQLPSVRALAAEHGANPLTVAKAYQSFQDDDYVEVRRGVGMFVLPGAVERLRVAERERFLTGHWPRVREHIALLGLDASELLGRELA